MPITAADDAVSSALSALLRALVWIALTIGAALALVFAFAAAMVVGLLIAGAALAMRLTPRRKAPRAGPEVLDARRTPTGWVVEANAKR